MSTDKLIIFDTTLRDGEQSPGASMTRDEKIRIARALETLRVDIIEAGFPIASDGDFESVKAVAEIIKDSTVCALARALPKDVDRDELIDRLVSAFIVITKQARVSDVERLSINYKRRVIEIVTSALEE